ncbi:hypothetical protein VN12_24170 [Pirellula sp. SH-Sr6A]|uniref:hypothetical protein n=1 Tax=Pirellula sp. SH-Sr6A TaxID=1632865 RepID=UPI00078BAFA5|nr:hypothetical protein [Pirellula sp. SH-Sr6A]AMV35243.1 hypothetical protein VN12_24170 [Pirellula sp. SH-Sr6A]
MSDTVRIRLSLGLLVVAVVHAILVGVVFTALHDSPAKDSYTELLKEPPFRPSKPSIGQIEKLDEPLPVNIQAQQEIKQGIFGNRTGRFFPVRTPSVYPSVYAVPRTTERAPLCTDPSKCPLPASGNSPSAQPVIVPPKGPDGSAFKDPIQPPLVVTPVKAPESKAYQLALFVGDDSQSRRLIQWFESNPKLLKLRELCEFQIYTESNPLYRERFASIVPREQFPVVLLQDAKGGHIHAAGRAMIPSTPEELYSDLQYGYQLYEQALQAEKTGAIRSAGYSWDEMISPTMTLFSQDCPDGFCPIDTSDRLRPGARIRDRLFDEVNDGRSAILWASAGEMITLALIVVAVLLLGFILIKRGV